MANPRMKILIELEGGVVQGVFADNPGLVEVCVFDVDNIKEGDQLPKRGNYLVEPLESFSYSAVNDQHPLRKWCAPNVDQSES